MDSQRPRNSVAAPVVARSYQDFEPTSEWVRDQTSDTLLIHLPGFKKEQIKVQIDSYGNLKTSGESPLNSGSNRWSRFRKDFHIPETLSITGIRAKFENGVLSVILPKLTTTNRSQQAELMPAAAVAAEAKPTTQLKAEERDSSSDEPHEASEPTAEARKVTTQKMQEKEKVDDVPRPEEPTNHVAGKVGGGASTMADAGPREKEQPAETGGGRWSEKARCYGVGGMMLGRLRKKPNIQQVVIVAVGVVSVGLIMYLAYNYKSIKDRAVSEITNY